MQANSPANRTTAANPRVAMKMLKGIRRLDASENSGNIDGDFLAGENSSFLHHIRSRCARQALGTIQIRIMAFYNE